MYVTELSWCDFVVWSHIEDIFMQHVYFSKPFMGDVIMKAKSFYLNLRIVYLPSVASSFIISRSGKQLNEAKHAMQMDGS